MQNTPDNAQDEDRQEASAFGHMTAALLSQAPVNEMPAKPNMGRPKTLVPLTAFGQTKPVADWAKDARCKVDYNTLRRRVRGGWEGEDALTREVKRGRPGRKPPASKRPRRCFATTVLLTLVQGAQPYRTLASLPCGHVRTFNNRLSELRAKGLIVDTVALTPKGQAMADELFKASKEWEAFDKGGKASQ